MKLPAALRNWLARFRPKSAPVRLFMLPAEHGDALLLQWVDGTGETRHIWVDGGMPSTYELIGKSFIEAIRKRKEQLDLVVVSHVDQDHIGGILAWHAELGRASDLVHAYWFNAGRTLAQYFVKSGAPQRDLPLDARQLGTSSRSIGQGMRLEQLLTESGRWHQAPISRFQLHSVGGADLMVLSPGEAQLRALHEDWQVEVAEAATTTRSLSRPEDDVSLETLAKRPYDKDDSVANGSSLAFVFEWRGRRILLAGDAPAEGIVAGLRRLGYSAADRLQVDLVKLSHHGSRRSTSPELLDLIDCYRFAVSTDGSRYGLPNRETFARILLHPQRDPGRTLTFYFNYRTPQLLSLFSAEEPNAYNFRCVFPEDGTGCVVEL